MNVLDFDRCYHAAKSRDRRFDGWFFVGVHTTGIYCRPSCPAVTPKRSNVEFFPSAAAAQQHGFRACRRCRPDATPGSPEWDVRGDVVARAVRLIGDGVVDRDGVDGLAARMGYSSRHLTRLVTDELGAGPLALARAQRAQTARVLIETTDLTMTEIAFAAGFGSVRQFNDTVRQVYAASPSSLRSGARRQAVRETGSVTVRVAARPPFAHRELLAFLADRVIPGIEHWDGVTYTCALDLPHGEGSVTAHPADDHIAATFRLSDWRDLAPAVGRLRHALDLDADAPAIDEHLGGDPLLRPSVATTPGRRAPRTWTPWEAVVRAIVGQQISVAGARTVLGQLAESLGEPVSGPTAHVRRRFPTISAIAGADPSAFPMPRRRGETLREVARRALEGELGLDVGDDRSTVAAGLMRVTGIGPWTADYVMMRGFGDPDVALVTDLGIRGALERLGASAEHCDRWRPWRSYGMHHLWAMRKERS